ncbi:MAG: TetR family transcriptional regulator, partial [Nitrospinaceae bacterium]|nr:helix-turn-helix transcriptional regulator [Nitrospinaceae bacterium]NIS85910.1 helix-turn-helix transcriptional regulator [Nitrospinaceae bacterium]NIT82758.1 helix-turn-helix transcriptional regulator [Nitrospinaceae bacterium]NIU97129.1 TetR family transcriptional regulator [Nitrospinaceae bacterium]NIY16026.1 TetR family transcriptional regulator [Nitrospinaceae bacterium]
MAAERRGSESRKDQILQAALGLVATQGLQGLNMAALARRVGLVPSALYRHFKGRDEILDAVIELWN